jgi:hypothetical protein
MSVSVVSAIYTATTIFTVATAASIVAAASIIATAISSVAASDRCPHPVKPIWDMDLLSKGTMPVTADEAMMVIE